MDKRQEIHKMIERLNEEQLKQFILLYFEANKEQESND